MNKILCTICMRGGSQGVKNKNIRSINGKPLMYFTIKQAIKSGIFLTHSYIHHSKNVELC